MRTRILFMNLILLILLLFSTSVNAQVTIGSDNPPSAKSLLDLDASATQLGLHMPRLNEIARNALVNPASTPADKLLYRGLTVYNLDSNCIEFWNGETWAILFGEKIIEAQSTLICGGTSLDPSITVRGGEAIPAGTFLKIPYTSSNGGIYNGITLTSTSNPAVTATIASGTLSPGSGVLAFSLQGTPIADQVAPNGIQFDLTPFLTVNPGLTGCNSVVVGHELKANIESIAAMGYMTWSVDNNGTKGYSLQITSPDGKFSFRVFIPAASQASTVTQANDTRSVAAGEQRLNVNIRNNTSSDVPVIWNFNTDYGGALSTMGIVTIPPNVWGGENDGGTTWYSVTPSNPNRYFGQEGIYDGEFNGPEYRRYTWIPQGTNKVAYTVYVMVALDTTTPRTAVHPSLVKAYIKFEQVTAI